MAGWSSLVARLAHNQEVVCSNHTLRNLLSAFVKQTSVVRLIVNSPTMWELSVVWLERQTVNLDVGGSNPSVPVTLLL